MRSLLWVRNSTYIGEPFVKYIKNGVWELRTNVANNQVRIFFIIDSNNIILLHGFYKKTNKTPNNEIGIAISRMKDYYNI